MNRYDSLQKLKEQGARAYLPFVLLGFPTKDITVEICRHLIEQGVHGLELGLPFRDPVADGPIIQQAGNEVLDSGFKVDDAIATIARIRALSDDVPLTLMSYYNMVFARGPERFFGELAAAGLDGILIPDMPPERADEIAPIARKHNIEMVFIAAPNSTDDRLKLISNYAGGFVYVVTRLGITGIDETHSSALPALFSRIKQHVNLPAIAGFGISQPAHAVSMSEAGADGVITGSRIVELVRQGYKDGQLNPSALIEHTKSMMNVVQSSI